MKLTGLGKLLGYPLKALVGILHLVGFPGYVYTFITWLVFVFGAGLVCRIFFKFDFVKYNQENVDGLLDLHRDMDWGGRLVCGSIGTAIITLCIVAELNISN